MVLVGLACCVVQVLFLGLSLCLLVMFMVLVIDEL